jgi:hypothetical protein
MALVATMLKQNPALSGLSDDVLKVIEQMSAADQQAVVDAEFKRNMDLVDTVIAEVSGKPITHGKKTTDWLKEEFTAVKTKAASADALTSEIATLKTQVADGKGAEVLSAQLKAAQTQLDLKEAQLQAINTEKATIQANYEKVNKTLEEKDIRMKFDLAVAGKTEKVPDAKEFLKLKVNGFLNSHTKEVATGTDGKEITVWRNNESKQILLDPSKGNSPMDEAGWLQQNVGSLFDFGTTASGAGSGKSATAANNVSSFADWKGAKTKVDAMRAINDHLFAKGIATSDKSYNEEWEKVVGDDKAVYEALPGGFM